MKMRKVAAKFEKSPLEFFNAETQSFEPTKFKANVSTVDRFLSNYNRPLRRRLLHHDPAMPLPHSRIIRTVDTGEVYLVGETRKDGDGRIYNGCTLLHLSTPNDSKSAGLADVIRKVPLGPVTDPGWLEPKRMFTCYADTEMMTQLKERDVFDLHLNSSVVFFPASVALERYDLIRLNGRILRVSMAYPDSGFVMARVVEEDDDRVNIIYTPRESTGRTYDTATRKMVGGSRDYRVTVQVIKNHDFADWNKESQDYLDLVISHGHIGVIPSSGDKVQVGGRQREVKSVDVDVAVRQYRLRVV